ncbi:MAG: hypothetical protein R3F49_23405 [Planctomycetota bacterium]
MRVLALLAVIAFAAGVSWTLGPVDASSPARTQEITKEIQAELDRFKETIQDWANEGAVTAAVAKQNEVGPIPGMTKDEWKKVRRSSDLVKGFMENDAAKSLAKHQAESKGLVVEAFVSAAKGEKVAFLAKTSSYVHKGSKKFDTPFDTGKAWQGEPEFDESTQAYQVQVSVPVMVKEKDTDEKPTKRIGVLVIGVDISKFKK